MARKCVYCPETTNLQSHENVNYCEKHSTRLPRCFECDMVLLQKHCYPNQNPWRTYYATGYRNKAHWAEFCQETCQLAWISKQCHWCKGSDALIRSRIDEKLYCTENPYGRLTCYAQYLGFDSVCKLCYALYSLKESCTRDLYDNPRICDGCIVEFLQLVKEQTCNGAETEEDEGMLYHLSDVEGGTAIMITHRRDLCCNNENCGCSREDRDPADELDTQSFFCDFQHGGMMLLLPAGWELENQKNRNWTLQLQFQAELETILDDILISPLIALVGDFARHLPLTGERFPHELHY